MPQSKFFAKFRLPGPGPYDLVSTDAEVADYHVLKQKILADEEKRKQARRMLKMESRESGMKDSTTMLKQILGKSNTFE